MDPQDHCDLLSSAGLALLAAGVARRATSAGAAEQADNLESAANSLLGLADGQAPAAAHPPQPPAPPPAPPQPGRPQPPRRR